MYPVSASRNWEQLGLKRESPALAAGSVKDLDSREGTRYFKAGALLQGADTHENTISPILSTTTRNVKAHVSDCLPASGRKPDARKRNRTTNLQQEIAGRQGRPAGSVVPVELTRSPDCD